MLRLHRIGKGIGIIAVAGAMITPSVALGQVDEFFGEDLNAGSASGARPESNQAQQDFLDRLQGVGTEDFEDIPSGTEAPFNVQFDSGTGTVTTATLQGSGVEIGTSAAGSFPTSGDQFVDAGAGNDFTIEFSQPQAAFGFFATDVGDVGGQLSLDTDGNLDTVITVPHTVEQGSTNVPSGNAFYYGFVANDSSDTFTSVAFNNDSGGDQFGFDDMTIGTIGQVQPPPEPTTIPTPSIAASGLVLLGLLTTRRRLRK